MGGWVPGPTEDLENEWERPRRRGLWGEEGGEEKRRECEKNITLKNDCDALDIHDALEWLHQKNTDIKK